MTDDDYKIKLYILINSSLDMTKGKAAAQASHAVLKVFFDRMHRQLHLCDTHEYKLYAPPIVDAWMSGRFTKVALKLPGSSQMIDAVDLAKDLGVWTSMVIDDGRTQVEPNSLTAACVGPFDTTDPKNLPLMEWLAQFKLY